MATEERPYPLYFNQLPPNVRAEYEGMWDNGWDGTLMPPVSLENFMQTMVANRPSYEFEAPPMEEDDG